MTPIALPAQLEDKSEKMVTSVDDDKIPDEPVKHIEDDRVQLKSSYDRLSIWQSLKTFKRAVLICGLTGFSASTDGKSI